VWYDIANDLIGGAEMYISMYDINTQYDGEWIYAIDCQEDDVGTILGGKVVLHSRNRDDVIRGMLKRKEENPASTLFRYAGRIPEEVSLLL
jgi:hypothetical protein